MRTHTSGFTLLELLIVIGLFTLLTLFSASALGQARDNLALSNDVREITAALRLAQNNAVVSLHGQPHGLYFKNDSYVVFSGSWSAPFAAKEYHLRPGVNFYNSGDQQIIFERLTGNTSALSTTDTIFIGREINDKKEITVDTLGNIFIKD